MNQDDTSRAPEFRIIERPHGVSFILPPRNLGKLRWLGLIAWVFAAIIFSMALAVLSMVAQFIGAFLHYPIPWYTTCLITLLLGLLWLVYKKSTTSISPGFGLLLIGLGMIYECHSEIRIDGDDLLDIEHAGPFSATMVRRKRTDITLFRITSAGMDSPSDKPTIGTRFFSIQALPAPDSKQKDFAPGYSRALLLAVAEALHQRLGLASTESVLQAGAVVSSDQGPRVEAEPLQPVRAATLTPEDLADLPQPPSSKIQWVDSAGPSTLLIPPVGFTGSALSVFLFGIGMSIFSLVFMGMSLWMTGRESMLFEIPFIVVGLVFLGLGLAILLQGVQLSRQRTVLVADPTSLIITQTGPLKKSEQVIARAQMAAITSADSGTSINNQPLRQLQIRLTNRENRGFLTGRPEPELSWLASKLRQKLQVGKTTVPPTP